MGSDVAATKIRGLFSPLLVRAFVRDWRESHRQDVRVQIGVLAALVGILVNLVMGSLKLAAGLLIASLSLIADAIDSFGDVAQGVITLVGFKVAAKAPDHGHPYGHERAEEIAALVVATLLIVAGLQFGVQATRRLFGPPETQFHSFALAVGLVSIVVKFGLSRMSFQFATYIDSRVLRGNAWNYLMDVASSALTVVAVAGRYYRVYWLDPLIAILISLLIIRIGLGLFRDSSDHLLGKGGTAEEVEEIHKVACSAPGVLGCADIEVHKYGRRRVVSLRIQVPDTMTLRESHEVAERVEQALTQVHRYWEPVVHVDPVATHAPRGGHTAEALTE